MRAKSTNRDVKMCGPGNTCDFLPLRGKESPVGKPWSQMHLSTSACQYPYVGIELFVS